MPKSTVTPLVPAFKSTAFGKETLALKNTLLSEYRFSDAPQLALLEIALEAHDRMQKARALLAEHGDLFKDRYGQLKPNPALVMLRDSRAGFIKALRELGFDDLTAKGK